MGHSPASEVASKQLSARQTPFRKGKRRLDKVIETLSRVRIEKGLKALIRGGSLTLEEALAGVKQTYAGQP